MSDKKISDLPFDSEDPQEQQLWSELKALPRGEPSPEMRRSFYRKLERAATPGIGERLRHWLGFSGNNGWITAAACLLLGIGAGQVFDRTGSDGRDRLELLEQNVALLNRELILDRLEAPSATKRLRGVIDATAVVEQDAEVARALLVRASEDRVHSIRTAAIDALAPQLSVPAVCEELMILLEDAKSPLVQLALVDLVLRNGSEAQLERLLDLANEGKLHPDLVQHVRNSLGSESV